MPRQPRIRESIDPEPGGAREARRVWLSAWKKWAVNELSAETPRPLRVQLRSAVERALAHFSPADDEAEVRDVVAGVVDEAQGEFRAEADRGAQAETKRQLASETAQIFAAVLSQFPQPAVTAMLQRPGYSRLVLTERLRRFLDQRLTGAEPPERILEVVVGWIERRLAEQPRVPSWSRLAINVRKAVPLVTAASVIALQNPAVRGAVVKHGMKARDTVRAWVDKLTPPQGPAKP
jgi:hypothetical protein